MAGITLEPLPPREAIEFFRSKGLAPPDARFSWHDVWLEEHARSFVVAKAAQDDILQLFRDELDAALSEGLTQEQFIARVRPTLQSKGWWGKSVQRDPLTGELQEVQLGSRHRLRTIFDTNMRTSYAAGRWARIQRTKAAFPYLEYRQVDRPSARDAHKPFDGLIRPVDDPIWEIIYPPNGWFCGCSVRQVNDRMLKREGKEVSDPIELDTISYTNPRSGQVDELPEGVDPGFNSNPGAAWLNLRDRHDASRLDVPDSHMALDRGIVGAVQAQGMRGNDESLALYDLDRAPLEGAILGWSRSIDGAQNRSQVIPTDSMFDAMRDPRRSTVAIHTHPSSGSFSGADIQVMRAHPGLRQVVAVGFDGSIFRTAPGAEFARLTIESIPQFQEQTWRAVGRALAAGELTVVDANALAAHIFMEALQSAGYVAYAAAPSGRLIDIIDRNRSLIARLVSELLG